MTGRSHGSGRANARPRVQSPDFASGRVQGRRRYSGLERMHNLRLHINRSNNGAACAARPDGRPRPLRRLLIRLAFVLLTAGSVVVQPVAALADSPQMIVKPSKKPITRQEIRSMQRMLAAHGYDPGVIDGLAGSKTVAAIREYQARAGLRVDGTVSRRLINHLSRATVRLVQGMLTLQDYDPGRIDGFVGGKTKIAIRVYRSRAGLKVNSLITQNLVDHLMRETTKSVQRMLAARGYDVGPVDGVAGRKTALAIRDYQTQADLEVDGRISMGLVGHLTIESVKLVQGMLTTRGYDAGPVDGDLGRKTMIAIRKYQAQAGLVVDGKFSLSLLDHLSASSGGSARAPDYVGQGGVVTGYRRGDIEPIYEIGDTFAYSDGRVETVVRVGGSRVWWRAASGKSYTGYRNFLLPRVAWQTRDGKGESTIDLDIDEAWPAATRKHVSFSVSVFWTMAGPSSSTTKTSESWRCQRKPGKRVTVATGIFETIPIVCERTGAPPNLWHKRVWYYAPAVRHFVRRESISADEKRQVDLVAIRPGAHNWPAAARAGLGEAMQATLGNGAIGEEVAWGSTAIGAKFGIKPTSEFDRDDSVRCRTYVLIRSDADNSRVYPAVACRSGESEPWLVPVLDQDEGAVSAQLADRP